MSQKILYNDLMAIVTLTHNKPAYVGMCLLCLRIVLVYEFHYDYIENKYGNNSILLVTDTDNLMYEINIEDVYECFSKDKEY